MKAHPLLQPMTVLLALGLLALSPPSNAAAFGNLRKAAKAAKAAKTAKDIQQKTKDKKTEKAEDEKKASGKAKSGTSASAAAGAEDGGDCPDWVDYNSYSPATIPGGALDALRCKDIRFRSDGERELRSHMRDHLSTDDPPSALYRASYVYLCEKDLEQQSKPYPGVVVPCLWHADNVDMAQLKSEIAKLPKAQQKTVLSRTEDARAKLAKIAETHYPRKNNKRDYEVFYDLRNKTHKTFLAERKANAKVRATLAAFEQSVKDGEFEGCAAPLEEALGRHIKGKGKTFDQLTARLGAGIGYAITESLAKCYFYKGQAGRASALISLLRNERRMVSFEEQVFYASVVEAEKDHEQAQKLPHLKGKKYFSYAPSDLSAPRPPTSKTDDAWERARSSMSMRRVSVRKGTIQRVDKKTKTVHFKKVKVPLVDTKCKKTGRIARITRDGEFIYEEECTSKFLRMVSDQPDPVTLDDVAGLRAGAYIEALSVDDGYTVYFTAKSNKDDAALERLGPIVLR